MDNRKLKVIKKKNNKFGTQSITLQPLKGKNTYTPKLKYHSLKFQKRGKKEQKQLKFEHLKSCTNRQQKIKSNKK